MVKSSPPGLLLLFFLGGSLCQAQLAAQLATTDDGVQVLLSTSWRLAGESFEAQHQGIYRGSAGNWVQVTRAAGGPGLGRPFLSGDGSVAGWDRSIPCTGSCMIAVPRSTTEFQGLSAPVLVSPYNLIPSRNAQFLLSPGFLGASDFALQDVATGQTWSPPSAPYLRPFGVANDGTVIGLAANRAGGFTTPLVPNRVVTWRPGGEACEIFQAEVIRSAWISPDGARALVETSGPDAHQPRELWWVDLATGGRVRIAEAPPDGSVNFLDAVNHQISNDGSRVVYFWPSQAASLGLWQQGGEARVLARADEGFVSAVLSGDGRVVWALTAAGRLLRIVVDTGAAEVVLGALPTSLRSGYAGSVPGSAMLWDAPSLLPGLRFSSGGVEFPVIDESARDRIAIQIPWEVTGPTGPLIARRDENPFELAIEMYLDTEVRPVLAGDVRKGYVWVKAALQDFSALVSDDRPAPAGSTIHAWFYNLGPLDRPVGTGVPGPRDPASVPLAALGCFLLREPGAPGRGLEIPFLAYAPGLVGVYQADLTLPEGWPAGPSLLVCDSAGKSTSGWVQIG